MIGQAVLAASFTARSSKIRQLIQTFDFEIPMLCRILCTSVLAMAMLGLANGCDTRPKIVMPTKHAPPPPKLASGGGAPPPPAVAPSGVERELLPYPMHMEGESPLENKE